MNLSTNETISRRALRAEQLQQAYVSFLGGIVAANEVDRPDLDAIWGELDHQAYIMQGTTRGVFGPNDILIELGSNPGGHITISAKTATGTEEIQLSIHNGEPDFSITTQPAP